MSNRKTTKFTHGGSRPGAGRPATGETKVKLCVSVNEGILGRAKRKWRGRLKKRKTSHLMEKLLDLYATNAVSLEA
jgi:hypothetical protein